MNKRIQDSKTFLLIYIYRLLVFAFYDEDCYKKGCIFMKKNIFDFNPVVKTKNS